MSPPRRSRNWTHRSTRKSRKKRKRLLRQGLLCKSLCLKPTRPIIPCLLKRRWNIGDIARKQFTAGTDERIEADQKYLEAKKDYEKQKLDLDDDYIEKREKLEKELNENIQDLEEKRENAVADRKKDILSS